MIIHRQLYAMDMYVTGDGGWLRVLWAFQPPDNDYPVPLLFRIWIAPNPGIVHPEMATRGNVKVCSLMGENMQWEPISPELVQALADEEGQLHLLFDLMKPPDDDVDMPDDIADFLRGLLDDEDNSDAS